MTLFSRAFVFLLLISAPLVAFAQVEPAAEAVQEGTVEPEMPPMPDKVARVGGQIITGEEFLRHLHYSLLRTRMQQGEGYQPGPDFQRRNLMGLIESRVLQMLAKESGLTVDDALVRKEFERGREGFVSDEDYVAYLEALGTDESQLMEEIRARLLTEAYVERETADITLTEEELREQYEKVREQGAVYRSTKTIDFLHLFVRPRGTDIADWGAARDRIDAIRGRIEAGESMEALARELSDDPQSAPRGGMYYEVRKEDAPEPFADQLFTMPLETVSEPIRSSAGWHLIKVVALHNPGTVSFEQLEPMLRHGLQSAKKAARVAQIVGEARGRIPVDIYTQDGEPIPLPPPTDGEEETQDEEPPAEPAQEPPAEPTEDPAG